MATAATIVPRHRLFAIGLQERALATIDGLAAKLGRKSEEAQHLQTGKRGELAAYFHLRKLGYMVVARRWTNVKLRGDVDLIAWHEGELCFIEVKTRTRRDADYSAEMAVDRGKQEMLRRMAYSYLRRFDDEERRGIATRFDVVSVYLDEATPQFEHFAGAFGWH